METMMATMALTPKPRGVPAHGDRRIDGNVDPTTGPIDHAGSLRVAGDVVDLMRVRCDGSLMVRGVIQAADVQVSGNIEAAGGISGRDKGRCRAAGDVTAHYLQKALVEAGGDVHAMAEVRASWIVCGGKFINRNGRTLCGSVMAAGGIICSTLGSPTGIATIVGAGNGPALQDLSLRAAGELELYREKARRAAALGNRLLRDQKRLSAYQKERATELLFKSHELEAAMRKTLAMIRVRYEDAVRAANAEIQVAEVVHPGVIIRFHGMEASIDIALRGPLRIAPQGGASRCITVTEKGGRSVMLPTRIVIKDKLDGLLQLSV